MARDRGNKKESGATSDAVDESGGGLIPDLARRVIGMGLSGFFLTEETIRRAVGDTLPKDWADFAVDQSERTRKEFLERLSFEIAQSIEKVDLAGVMRELLEGRTLEVRAEIRLGGAEPSRVNAALQDDGEEKE